ncbi:hypothetical protein OHB26_37060 [Nocardia sp. NBC_01503]|uniref:hypothetical protein n=1 Tax=Nocardia sp. NBC_01503 TaxID=2975997 RepID=UPI002E7ADCE6|nr:hypothetical protein [Nocardia sp. NBC_01503]WTL32409.1 hypothetical protein OHB26_37060 [Nocardia sp. NBC_01503]
MTALRRGLGLLPLTRELGTGLSQACGGLTDRCPRWSTGAPILLARNETHGGSPGEQSAELWLNRRIIFSQSGFAYHGPISMALLRMGVTDGRIGRYEAELIGLSRHATTSAWRADAE